jgi:A/G-specific adenine glycosylase
MNKTLTFSAIITKWYSMHKRDLPWRETNDPYAIWLSEVILQQTRIEQGLAYYRRFIGDYPLVQDFALATEDEILKKWQGLGYYSRARNMHQAAKIIVEKFDGKFPGNYKNLIKLKGIGEYTAAAIASIAFNLPHAAVDGNVFRVLSRVFGIAAPIDTGQGKKVFYQLANELLDRKHPGQFNEALMEFGALQCVPRKPDCGICPFKNSCVAYLNDLVDTFPVKRGKVQIKKRYFNYLVVQDEKHTFLTKRSGNDIWKNLYEFPLVESPEQTDTCQTLLEQQAFFSPENGFQVEGASRWKKQVLTHQHIFFRFIYLKLTGKKNIHPSLIRVNKTDIFNFAVPKPVEMELENINWF